MPTPVMSPEELTQRMIDLERRVEEMSVARGHDVVLLNHIREVQAEHTATLAEHTATLAEHTTALAELKADVVELKADVKEIRGGQGAIVAMLQTLIDRDEAANR